MYVSVSQDGEFVLCEVDDFGRFHISVDQSDTLNLVKGTALATVAEVSNNGHFWIDADAIVKLSNREDDPVWCEAFWDMVRKADKFGYADLPSRRIKAHIVQRSES